jgi:hypothetical protein
MRMAEFTGVMHVHSTFSDGDLSPVEIRDWAVAEELDFVCITDHSESLTRDRRAELGEECRRLSTGPILLPAIEFAHSGRHVIALASDECLMALTDEEVVTRPEAVRERGGMTIWAHPAATYDLSLRDGAATRYDGWEIWNLKVDGLYPNLPVISLLERTARRSAILPFVGWDLHGAPKGSVRPRMVVSTATSELTRDALLQALRRGDFRICTDTFDAAGGAAITIRPSTGQRLISILRHRRTRAICAMKYLAHRMTTRS